ncbi:MAG: TonB-dependent receptor [candidate division KSB1 bacterium]|nr:TonB-dependent receptor [candidate division KSB1 bacterium]MDZ7317812.1 TonB-dependent receptor [candidate division KSB1 bacterium]MDZ7341636.1 TonB-dependent receptor [candidate division KSB1 bacterium]
MRKAKLTSVLATIPLLLSMVAVVFAGTTGKIAGRVTDRETGNPLPGANVVIVGTSMGAASDLNGNFIILNVPPGSYDVKATVIGYAAMTVQEVRVKIDQTERVDFALQIQVIEGEVVTVVASKNPVKADVSTSVSSFASNEVATLPITNVADVVGLQAGVERGLSIRGGGAGEALFQLDGVTLRDPRNNMPITNVAVSSIQEISIERGGFNAEYGQVRSGIVNIVTREGEVNRYNGNLIFKYSAPGRKHFGMSPFDPNATMLRPFLDPAVCWTGTSSGAWDEYTQRQYPEFDGWNAVSRQLLSDGDPTNDLSPAAAQQLFRWQHRRQEVNDQPDYNLDASFGGPVPFISQKLGNLRFQTSYRTEREMLLVPLSRPDYKDYYWSLKLNSNITPAMKLTVASILGKGYYVAQNEAGLDNNASYVRSPDEVAAQIANINSPRATSSRLFCDSYYSAAEVGFGSWSAKLTHVLSPQTFYDLSLEHIYRRYQTGPIRRREMTRNIEFAPGKFTNEAPFGFSPQEDNGIDGMMTGGHTSTVRDSSRIAATTLKFDLSSQVDVHNLVKAGFEFVYGDLNLDYGEVKEIYIDGNTYVKMHKFPLRGAMYVQDKLELQGLIVNAGLRLDYSDANSDWPTVAVWEKDFYSSNYIEGMSFPTKPAKARFSLSPRLGVSHPITQNAKLFFNYGHFKQLPTYEQMFRLSRGGSNEVQGIGDPNLKLEKTIAYELGFDYALLENYLVQLAAFYRDISNQRDYTSYFSADGSINYLKASNNNYADVRGFELTLRKSIGNWWLGFLNYTYQVSTSGHFGKAEIYQDPKAQRDYDRNTRMLYQERPIPTPFARAKLSFFTPRDFGFQWLGIRPLAEWNLNVLADWRAGAWVTWNPSRKLNVAQNVKARDWYNIDLRLMKTWIIGSFDLTFFIDVENALNTKRLSLNSFYDSHDYNFYFQSLHLPRSNDYDNIVGNDKVGDYRKAGVAFQPIEKVGNVYSLAPSDIKPRAIYYDAATGRYMSYVNSTWSEVDRKRMKKILDDKAYIDMPNHSYFNFLNPRQIFFGINASFRIQ